MNASVPHCKNIFVRPVIGPYTPASVITKRKLAQLVGVAILAVGTAGCGGINAGKSVSPLDFILPGLIQTGPPPANPPATTNSVQVVAQVP